MLIFKLKETKLPPTTFSRFVVDDEKCNGCGRCVETCPIQLLELRNEKSRANERYDHFRCITCQNCVVVCPKDAITIEGDYRVSSGYWKNDHLFPGPKTNPAPFEGRNGQPFTEYENELTETEKVIYKRRSIRLYKKKQVPKEMVKRVLDAARFAPSAGNNQPWKFIVIQKKELIDEINTRCKESLKIHPHLCMPHDWKEKQTPGVKDPRFKWWQHALIPMLAYLKPGDYDQRVRGGVNTVTSDPDYHIFFNAPTLIILLADKRAIGGTELDMGICGETMVLAAHSLGLGTCWVGLIDGLKLHPKFRKKILGVEYPFEIVSSITLGYPAGKIDHPVKREQLRVDWLE